MGQTRQAIIHKSIQPELVMGRAYA